MTKELEFKIGSALHKIALVVDHETFKKIEKYLSEIEDIVIADREENGK